MTNLEYIRSIPPEKLCEHLIGTIDYEISGSFYCSPSGDEFRNYDDTVADCLRWLNLEHFDKECTYD